MRERLALRPLPTVRACEGAGEMFLRIRFKSIVRWVLSLLLLAAACEESFDRSAALRRAEKAARDRRYDDAINVLRNVIAHDTDDVESRFQLGLAYGLSRRPFDARLEFMQVIELDSMRADAYEHLGLLAFGGEDNGEAIEMLGRAVALGARGIQVYDTLQYLHFQAGTIKEAMKWARRAIQTNPRDPRFRYKLATLSHFVGSYEEARDVIEPLLSDYPDYWDALLLAGKVYRQLGAYEKALEALNKAGPREKGRLEFAQELGMVKLKTGDPEGAAESFEEVIRSSPEKAEAHYGLGQAYLKMGERDKAKAALQRFRGIQLSDKVLKSNQTKFISNWQEALSKETDGDYEGAYESYREALEYNPGDVSTQVLIWLLRRNQGYKIDAARAYRTVEKLLSAQDREFNALAFTLAVRLIKRGFDIKAVEVLNELLLRDPESRAARFELIRAYSRLGRDEERERHLNLFRTGEISPNP